MPCVWGIDGHPITVWKPADEQLPRRLLDRPVWSCRGAMHCLRVGISPLHSRLAFPDSLLRGQVPLCAEKQQPGKTEAQRSC